jgi:hypothetical protein
MNRRPDYQASCAKCGFFVSGLGKQQTIQIAKRDHHHCKEQVVIQKKVQS